MKENVRIISVFICVPGREYPGDKTKLARVILDNGTGFFFGLGDDCSEQRAVNVLLPMLVTNKYKKNKGAFII
jgi:hypothetical protein